MGEQYRDESGTRSVCPGNGRVRRNVAEMIDRYILEHLPKPMNKDQKDSERRLRWWKDRIGDTKLPRLTPDRITSTCVNLLSGKTRTGEKRPRARETDISQVSPTAARPPLNGVG